VAEAELPFEFMLNALRLVQGFPATLFAERTGLALSAVEAQLAAAEAQGLIVRDHARIAPSDKGRRFLNDLLETFLAAPAERARRTISIYSADTPRP
jgi:coproporphyrinogen III oxidase-like Fe-S oxidoreductase